MKLLLLNPNTSQSVTDLIERAALAVRPDDVEIGAMTAPRGVPYIATRAEAVIGGTVALEMLSEVHGDYDAAVIAAFGDPGLGGARELFDIPVIGLAEAGMLTACALGRKFAIISFSGTLAPWYAECVAWHGMEDRCCGIRTLDVSVADVGMVQDEAADALVNLALSAIREDGADVIVLAGAPLAGLAASVREQIPVPTVDCVAAAVGMATSLMRMKPIKATEGTFRRPGPKPTSGLPTALALRIEGQDPAD